MASENIPDRLAAASNHDITGRTQLARNVAFNYVGHLVFVVFGFIMPRAIDSGVGQVGLGVWDLSWSFVNYLNLSMLGIGSSVNRYVARYRASNDNQALNSIVSSVICIQLPIAVFVLCVSLLLAHFVPLWLADRLGDQVNAAGWVIALLGASLAFRIAFDAWRGVISGCHRWDYYNYLNSGGYAVTAVLMIIVLAQGGGLIGIALIYFAATVVTECLRYFIARRVCPELVVRISYANLGDAKKAFRFGIKSILLGAPDLVISQSVNIVVAAILGPAALAILARPLALVRHVATFAAKFSHVLTPTAGSLQSQNKKSEIREFAIQSARTGWLIAIPPLVFLIVLGDFLVALWMGDDYRHWGPIATLAIGFMLPISQSPLTKVMVGLNAHGRIAKAGIILSMSTFLIGLIWVSIVGLTLSSAAALMAGPLFLGTGVAVLYHGLRYLEIDAKTYFVSVLARPAQLFLALLATLIPLRFYSPFGTGTTALIGALATGLLSMVLLRKEVLAVLASLRSDRPRKPKSATS